MKLEITKIQVNRSARRTWPLAMNQMLSRIDSPMKNIGV